MSCFFYLNYLLKKIKKIKKKKEEEEEEAKRSKVSPSHKGQTYPILELNKYTYICQIMYQIHIWEVYEHIGTSYKSDTDSLPHMKYLCFMAYITLKFCYYHHICVLEACLSIHVQHICV